MDNLGFELRESNADGQQCHQGGESVEIAHHETKNGPTYERNANDSKSNSGEDEADGIETNFLGRIVVLIRSSLWALLISNKRKLKFICLVGAVIAFHIYLAFAIIHSKKQNRINWCDGAGLLIILTGFTYWLVFYYVFLKRLFGKKLQKEILDPLKALLSPMYNLPYFSTAVGCLCCAGVLAFVLVDTWQQPKRLVSAGGVFVVLGLGLLISKYPGRVKWGQVVWGLGLQFLFAVIILRWGSGRDAFDCLSGKVSNGVCKII